MKNLLVSCGCSYSYKLPGLKKSFSEIVSEKSKLDFLNLSRVGASNYHISKQIEYAASLKPSMVIINSTTAGRFDYISNPLTDKPTLKNFMYGPCAVPPHTNANGNITSMTAIHMQWKIKHTSNTKEKEDLTKILNFIVDYQDSNVKADQDRLMLLGSLSLLSEQNIKFYIIDLANIFDILRSNMIQISWKEIAEKFPYGDNLHFNQEGHNFIADKFLSMVSLV